MVSGSLQKMRDVSLLSSATGFSRNSKKTGDILSDILGNGGRPVCLCLMKLLFGGQ